MEWLETEYNVLERCASLDEDLTLLRIVSLALTKCEGQAGWPSHIGRLRPWPSYLGGCEETMNQFVFQSPCLHVIWIDSSKQSISGRRGEVADHGVKALASKVCSHFGC